MVTIGSKSPPGYSGTPSSAPRPPFPKTEGSQPLVKMALQIDKIEKLYNTVVEALNISADLCIPRTRRNFYKFWWSQELSELKAAAVNSSRA